VRQIIVRHWLETEQLSATAINGVLYMRGSLQFRPAKRSQSGDVTADFMEKLERELNALKELKKIHWQLDNWQRDESGWTRQDGGRASGTKKASDSSIGKRKPF
jgi:hypothetical protein